MLFFLLVFLFLVLLWGGLETQKPTITQEHNAPLCSKKNSIYLEQNNPMWSRAGLLGHPAWRVLRCVLPVRKYFVI